MPPWDMVEALGTWFAGVATAGSLFLGFSILRSDRKKEQRSQALRFVYWDEGRLGLRKGYATLTQYEPPFTYRVVVHNTSDQPIVRPMLELRRMPPRTAKRKFGRQSFVDYYPREDVGGHKLKLLKNFDDYRNWYLPPRAFIDRTIELPAAPDIFWTWISFVDATGTSWRRDLATGKLSRNKGPVYVDLAGPRVYRFDGPISRLLRSVASGLYALIERIRYRDRPSDAESQD